MRTYGAVAVAIILASCGGPSKKQDVASCNLEALRVYSHEHGPDLSGLIGQYTATCMEAKGYKMTFTARECAAHGGDFLLQEIEADCYVRENSLWAQ